MGWDVLTNILALAGAITISGLIILALLIIVSGVIVDRCDDARQQPSRQFPERDEFEQVHGELN